MKKIWWVGGVSEWPVLSGTCRGPSVPRAGWRDRPLGLASPVARAPRPRASKRASRAAVGGPHRRQEWGEVNPRPPGSPRQPLGTEMSGGWSVPDPVGPQGPKQTPLVAESTWQLYLLCWASPSRPSPTAGPRPTRVPQAGGSAELEPPGGTGRGAERRARCHREAGGEPPKCAEGGHLLQARWSPSPHVRGPFPPGGKCPPGAPS